MNDRYPATQEPVIVVGAGPAGCTAALLLADFGIPVTLLERHTQPHGCTPASAGKRRHSPARSCWAATAPTAPSASWPGSPWTTSASPNAGSWSTSRPRPAWTPGTAFEQICDPARAATFMQVTGDRYRWQFRLRDGEDEADLITPAALGQLLRPWTGRSDLDGLQIIRSATYTFRAQMASRFRSGQIFLLGDAAHLTPPFIGQGLAGGLRDADNLAWKLAYVLTGRAGENLLDTYDSERRPHATALVKKAVRVGWAMTGGQDRAAAVRRIALAAAVRSERVCQAMGSTATPRLRTGALQPVPRRLLPSGIPAALRPGGLIPNPLVSPGDGPPVRLDAVLAGRTAVLTGRRPDAGLADFCRRHGLALVRINNEAGRPAADPDAGWIGVRLVGDEQAARLQALAVLASNPALTVIIRPDRVIAAIEPRCRLPQLPWHIPATAMRGRPATTRPAAHPSPAAS